MTEFIFISHLDGGISDHGSVGPLLQSLLSVLGVFSFLSENDYLPYVATFLDYYGPNLGICTAHICAYILVLLLLCMVLSDLRLAIYI